MAGEVNHSSEVPIGEITSGAHTLSFRLDAYNDTKSEIDISNVQLGNKQAVENQLPIANAGADQIVNAGVKVALDSSSDPDHGPSPITYSRSQTSGPSVTLANATTPSLTPVADGTYLFQLIVNDGLTASAPDTVTITANDADCRVFKLRDTKRDAGASTALMNYLINSVKRKFKAGYCLTLNL